MQHSPLLGDVHPKRRMTFLSREAQLRMHFAATAAAATVAAATVATTMCAAAMRGAVAVLRAPTIARARADNDGSVVAAAAAVAERAVFRRELYSPSECPTFQVAADQ